MAFLWFGRKKKEEFDLGPELGSEAGFGRFDQPQYGQPPTDELGLPTNYGQNSAAPETFSPYPQQSTGQSFPSMPSSTTQRQFGSSQPYQQQPTGTNRDIDLLASKLDAIKATLDAIDQRLKTVERLMQGDEGYKFKKGW
ncbi:MAG: hypothetical protein Q7J54_06115 [Candidatus Woesearchaeota archaeon]|nr:hypothetical protein [Candidatus Woesearchaeota archaeon]